jgi:uncharacterized membrane protein
VGRVTRGPSTTRRLPEAALALVLGLCTALVVLGTAWKGACLDSSRNFRLTCYSDTLELFTSRGLDRHVFPYVNGVIVNGEVREAFEYPVLTGVFIWFSSLFADGRTSFLVASAVLMGPFAVLTGYHLLRLSGQRALLWAAAPALVLYALHNWDLLAVAAAVGGLYAWHRGRTVTAAVLFGLGTCLKIYPGLFLLPLAVERLVRGDRRGAVEALGYGGLTVLAVNLPFVLVNRDGWATTYVFQEARQADTSSNSIWYWVWPHLSTETLNRLIPVLVLLSLLTAVAYGLWRARREQVFPLLQVCGAALVAFLLWNKVSSPQYTLWVLPFFALLRVRIGWWVAYGITDLLVYVGVFRWFHHLIAGSDPTLAERMLTVGVWTKSALLVVLFAVFLRADDALVEEPAQPTPAQPTQRPDVKVSTSSAISGAQAAT